MLDEEKIKLMTKVTIYEKNEEMDALLMSKYYKEDYVKYGCLKTMVVVTFAYWITVAVFILLRFEQVMDNLNNMDYFKIITRLMIGYVIVMAVFYLYAFIVYNFKYDKRKSGIIRYNRWLKQLYKLYEEEEARENIRSGKIKVYSQIGGNEEDELSVEAIKAEKEKYADKENDLMTFEEGGEE